MKKKNEITQGKIKVSRLMSDYVRDYELRKILKRIKKEKKSLLESSSNEIDGLIDEFSTLKKKISKYHNRIGFKYQFATAEAYAVDGDMIDELIARVDKDERLLQYMEWKNEEIDMCRVEDLYEDELNNDPGGGIITLRPYLIMRRLAFPVAISIHPGASKNDVLDYIEKNWGRIENNLRRDEPFDKPLRMRKRKYSQEILDFIWLNKEFRDEEIKRRMDIEFPNNGFVYHEINKLLHLERERRNFRK